MIFIVFQSKFHSKTFLKNILFDLTKRRERD